jgi:endonuclease/exonuclease/phosphatase family metal-dependent hydrolase
MGWDAQCTRIVTWVKFKHLPTQREFLYLNTHFDHIGKEARINSAKLVEQKYHDEKGPIILTGDFNVPAGQSPAYDILMKAGFNDAWATAAKKSGPTHTFGQWKAPKPNEDGRIDWILYRGKAAVNQCNIVADNQDGRFPSDHYPVYAELVFD